MRPPPPFPRICMTAAPTPYLKVWIRLWIWLKSEWNYAGLPAAVRDTSLSSSPSVISGTPFFMLLQCISGQNVPRWNFDAIQFFQAFAAVNWFVQKVNELDQISLVNQNGKRLLTADKSLRLQVVITCNIVPTWWWKRQPFVVDVVLSIGVYHEISLSGRVH